MTVGVVVIPRLVCERGADDFFSGDLATQDALAQTVIRAIRHRSRRTFYQTGSLRFDGQSAVAIYQMTVLGLGQIIREHPEQRAAYLDAMRSATERLVDPHTLRYAATVYGHHGIKQMGPGEGHAYLGYINLALGMLRIIEPKNRHAPLHDRLTAQLTQRLRQSPNGLIETYPGETWPPDVAAVAGSIGLHGLATGANHQETLEQWATRFAACAIDESGYLVQRVRSGTCQPLDAPRGSGTAMAAYLVSFADATLSRRLYQAVRNGQESWFGFGGIREYAPGHSGPGDVNAGPIVAGISVGATGFALGAARANHDTELFRALYRTTRFFGVPIHREDGLIFVTGGTLGNALLLAMLTATPT